jgi:hypothetical protein
LHFPLLLLLLLLLQCNALQQVGSDLVTNVQNVNRLAEVQDNLQQAAAAVRAAPGVLEQCMAAGQLITEHQLYPALCMLDKIRRKHLGERAMGELAFLQHGRSSCQ